MNLKFKNISGSNHGADLGNLSLFSLVPVRKSTVSVSVFIKAKS